MTLPTAGALIGAGFAVLLALVAPIPLLGSVVAGALFTFTGYTLGVVAASR